MKKTKMLILAVSLILVTILFVSLNLNLQEQGKVKAQDDKKPKKTKAQEQDDIATPKVSYEDLQNKNTDKTTKRWRKNDKHNNSHWVLKPESAFNVGEAIRYVETSISDIPAQESNLILQGTVREAQAFLSNDNSGVYSEYGISVENVLKNNTNVNLNVNDFIKAERDGGIITYPSGKTVRYRIAGLGSPAKNSKYIFFLKKIDEDIYQILTAYEIQEDRVIPLDGARLNLSGNGKSVFDQHMGEDVQSFTKQIQEKIKNLTPLN